VKNTYKRSNCGEDGIVDTLLTLEITMKGYWINFVDLCEANLIRLCGRFRLSWNTIEIYFKLNGRFGDEEKSDTNPLTRKNQG
jgi:hypothetical protein